MSFLDTFRERTEELGRKMGFNGYLVYCALLCATVFIVVGMFDEYITMGVGVLIPAHMSMKALATPGGDDDKQWLTYWVVFSLFVIAELFFGYVLRFIPFYFLAKNAFLIWLMLPLFKGATVIYDMFLRSLFKRYESRIDAALDNATASAKKVTKKMA